MSKEHNGIGADGRLAFRLAPRAATLAGPVRWSVLAQPGPRPRFQ